MAVLCQSPHSYRTHHIVAVAIAAQALLYPVTSTRLSFKAVKSCVNWVRKGVDFFFKQKAVEFACPLNTVLTLSPPAVSVPSNERSQTANFSQSTANQNGKFIHCHRCDSNL
jgi:hypothetical protein